MRARVRDALRATRAGVRAWVWFGFGGTPRTCRPTLIFCACALPLAREHSRQAVVGIVTATTQLRCVARQNLVVSDLIFEPPVRSRTVLVFSHLIFEPPLRPWTVRTRVAG